MATFNWFDHLIDRIGEQLRHDGRFDNVQIYYDRERQPVPADRMPAITYFLSAPFEDRQRGTGATSMKTRRARIQLGFGIWCYSGESADELDRQLFGISADLLDWFYENRNYDAIRGILIQDDIAWDVDYEGGENGIVGTQLLTVNFESLTAP